MGCRFLCLLGSLILRNYQASKKGLVMEIGHEEEGDLRREGMGFAEG